jgi:hypothetical protein
VEVHVRRGQEDVLGRGGTAREGSPVPQGTARSRVGIGGRRRRHHGYGDDGTASETPRSPEHVVSPLRQGLGSANVPWTLSSAGPPPDSQRAAARSWPLPSATIFFSEGPRRGPNLESGPPCAVRVAPGARPSGPVPAPRPDLRRARPDTRWPARHPCCARRATRVASPRTRVAPVTRATPVRVFLATARTGAGTGFHAARRPSYPGHRSHVCEVKVIAARPGSPERSHGRHHAAL